MTMLDDALAVIDHVAARVTASAAAGLGGGAAYATLRGHPLFKTSMNAALSCALVSTACFGMERVAHGALCQSALLWEGANVSKDAGEAASTEATNAAHSSLVYASHALGGVCGGSVVGFLFQGKPLAGAFLLAPIMLGIGAAELSLEEYRTERVRQLLEEHNNERNERK